MSSVCPSVTLVDHDHVGWKSWKLIVKAWAQHLRSYLLPGEHGEIWGRLELGLALVRSSARHQPRPFVYVAGSYLYCWIMPILDQYCTTKAHRAVIFAIAQLSCFNSSTRSPAFLQDAIVANISFWFLPSPKKEVMFLVRSVCLSVCLSVCRITRKLVNGFGRNFWRGSSWLKD